MYMFDAMRVSPHPSSLNSNVSLSGTLLILRMRGVVYHKQTVFNVL